LAARQQPFSFGGLAIGFFIGIFFGLLRISRLRWLRWPAIVYVEVFRGTPILVQVLFIFYGLPQLLGSPINALVAGIAAIAVNSGAYISKSCVAAFSRLNAAKVKHRSPWGFPAPRHFATLFGPRRFGA